MGEKIVWDWNTKIAKNGQIFSLIDP